MDMWMWVRVRARKILLSKSASLNSALRLLLQQGMDLPQSQGATSLQQSLGLWRQGDLVVPAPCLSEARKTDLSRHLLITFLYPTLNLPRLSLILFTSANMLSTSLHGVSQAATRQIVRYTDQMARFLGRHTPKRTCMIRPPHVRARSTNTKDQFYPGLIMMEPLSSHITGRFLTWICNHLRDTPNRRTHMPLLLVLHELDAQPKARSMGGLATGSWSCMKETARARLR